MDKTRLVCLFAGLLVLGSVLFPAAVQAGVGVTPASLSFGSVPVNKASTGATLVVTNEGRNYITTEQVASSVPQFVVSSPALPPLAPRSTSFKVVFQPNAAATFSGSTTVTSSHRDANTSTVNVSGTGIAAVQSQTHLLSTSANSLSFDITLVRSSSSKAITLKNTGTGSVSISQVAATGAGFSVSGFSGSASLAPGQSLALNVKFAPAAAGAGSGSISVVSTATNSPAAISLSGTGVQPQISVTPSGVSFGTFAIGVSRSHTFTIKNPGTATLIITRASITGTGFSFWGLPLPLSVAPGGSSSFAVGLTPVSTGSLSGSLTLVNNSPNASLVIPLTGVGVSATLQLSAAPVSLSFGSHLTGTRAVQSITLKNTGTGSVNISQVTATGTGFNVTGFSGAVTLAAGQSLALTAGFAPTAAGTALGKISVVSTAANSPAVISLSGTGIQPQISVTPSSVGFGSVTVGVTNTQTVTIRNPGTATLSVTQASITGTGFSLPGLSLPLSVAPGGSSTFTVGFDPASTSSVTGSVKLTNNTPSSTLVVPLSGGGTSAVLQLSTSPSSLSFGSLLTGTSATQRVTLSNTGNASVSISRITVSGAGFSDSGIALPLTLAAGQSTSFSVIFAPASAGSHAGSVAVTSNAANSPLAIALSGISTTPTTYTVALTWTPSSSTFAGFNIYRGTVSGGPYTRVGASMISATSYTDSSVSAGQTYYYVATQLGSTGAESSYSSQVSVTIP